jgi:Na+/proline symporter
VQRYLTARSVDDARQSLLMSAYWKIPLQALVLLLGIAVFVFYVFNAPPLIFSEVADRTLSEGTTAPAYAQLKAEYGRALEERRAGAALLAAGGDADAFKAGEARVVDVHARATALVKEATNDRSFTDVNYIIPSFILTKLPIGLIGLLLAAIFLAATDSIAGELNSLSTATVIDFYRRWFRPTAPDAHYLPCRGS